MRYRDEVAISIPILVLSQLLDNLNTEYYETIAMSMRR